MNFSSMPMEEGTGPTPGRSWFILQGGLLLLSLLLIIWSGRWGLAGLHAYPAQLVLEAWEHPEHPRAPDREEWRLALDALERSRALDPGNPDHLLLLGRMHHHWALIEPLFSKAAKKHLQRAIDAYGQATERRPTWGRPWILWTQARVQNGDVSERTRVGLMRALALAPWSGDVQRTGIRLGFALWPLLDEPRRQVIRRITTAAFPRHGDEILRLAFKYRQIELVRPLLTDSPQWQWVYDRMMRLRKQGN